MSGEPIRIQRKRTPGWVMPENTVYVGRPGKWGNPFNLSKSEHCWTAIAHGFKGDKAGRQIASVAMFDAWIHQGQQATSSECGLYAETPKGKVAIALSPDIAAPKPPTVAEIIAALRGKNLACWCALDQPCHADVLLRIANEPMRAFSCEATP